VSTSPASSRRWPSRPGCAPTRSARMCCGTPSPATSCTTAPTCAWCRRCSATPTSRRRRSTPTCWRNGSRAWCAICIRWERRDPQAAAGHRGAPSAKRKHNSARRDRMSETWTILKEWPELILDRLADEGVARITLNRPEKRNCWNRPLCDAFLESLDIIRADKELKVVITKGAGSVYSSGLDLTFLREVSNGPLLDWDRPNLTIQIAEGIRAFPRIMIAQVHGYCLGGALGIMNCHDVVFAAEDAQLGMPEVLRGSFGQLVTST